MLFFLTSAPTAPALLLRTAYAKIATGALSLIERPFQGYSKLQAP